MDITNLLKAREGENIEFKEAKSRFDFEELTHYACAIANMGGGKIVLGVSDKRPRQIVGSQAFEQPERTSKGLMDRLHVKIDFEEFVVEGKRILVFTVASRPVGLPLLYNSIAYWRDGDVLTTMPGEEMRRIYEEGGHDFSADICQQATIADLDENAIEEFRKRWVEKSRNQRILTLPKQQLLNDCGAIDGTNVTYAALVLFGSAKALTKYLAQAEVVFEYRSSEASGPAAYRNEFRDAFFNIHDKIWNLINLRNDKQHYQDGLFIFDIDTFNEGSTREALLNAISHRNYQMAGSVFIRQYRDRLEITSPGGFPPGITPENIIDKQYPRNRRIAEILALCGLIERSGQGMNLMFENSVKEAKALPSFDGTDAYEVKLTLHGIVLDKNMLRLINRIGEETLKSFSTQDFLVLNYLSRDEKLPKYLNGRVKRLMEVGLIEKAARGKYIFSRRYYASAGKSGVYTRKKGLDRDTNKVLLLEHIGRCGRAGATNAEFQQVLPALSRGQIKTILNNLRKEGKIEVIGARRGARWFMVEVMAGIAQKQP